MTTGIKTFRANGAPSITFEGAGGVYVGTIRHSDDVANSYSYPYPALFGLSLRILQVEGDSFTWSVNNNSGYPTIVISPIRNNSHYSYGGYITLMVFAV